MGGLRGTAGGSIIIAKEGLAGSVSTGVVTGRGVDAMDWTWSKTSDDEGGKTGIGAAMVIVKGGSGEGRKALVDIATVDDWRRQVSW